MLVNDWLRVGPPPVLPSVSSRSPLHSPASLRSALGRLRAPSRPPKAGPRAALRTTLSRAPAFTFPPTLVVEWVTGCHRGAELSSYVFRAATRWQLSISFVGGNKAVGLAGAAH